MKEDNRSHNASDDGQCGGPPMQDQETAYTASEEPDTMGTTEVYSPDSTAQRPPRPPPPPYRSTASSVHDEWYFYSGSDYAAPPSSERPRYQSYVDPSSGPNTNSQAIVLDNAQELAARHGANRLLRPERRQVRNSSQPSTFPGSPGPQNPGRSAK